VISRVGLYNGGYTSNIENEIKKKNRRQGSEITRGTSISVLSAVKGSTVNEILVVHRVAIQHVYLLFCFLVDSVFLSACLWSGSMFCFAVPTFPSLHQNGTRRCKLVLCILASLILLMICVSMVSAIDNC
jgi:hypothetical protein